MLLCHLERDNLINVLATKHLSKATLLFDKFTVKIERFLYLFEIKGPIKKVCQKLLKKIIDLSGFLCPYF